MESLNWHTVLHLLEHTALDTLKMAPILLAVYLLLEFLEPRLARLKNRAAKFRAAEPFVGTLFGCIPQCGFSAAASSLYARGMIGGGTLIAVFLSTSDEAIPVMLANMAGLGQILALIAAKIVLAAGAGYLLQYTVFRKEPQPMAAPAEHVHTHSCTCCKERFSSPILNSIWQAVVRTVQVSLFVLAFLFAIELVIELIGEDSLQRLLLSGSIFQPLVTALIGLIPGCGTSVLITQLFVGGSIGFGSAVAGLATGTGVGYLVLAKECRNPAKIAKIIALTYLCAAVSGMILTAIWG